MIDEARREALLRISSGGARVRVGGKVFVREDERVGKAVAVFGHVEVNGIVSEEVVAIGGDVVLGPKAMVRGDVVSIGGVVRAAPGAYIGGTTGQVNMSPSDFKLLLPDDGEMTVAFQAGLAADLADRVRHGRDAQPVLVRRLRAADRRRAARRGPRA